MKDTSKQLLASSHYMQSVEWAGLRGATGWHVKRFSLTNNTIIHSYQKNTPLGGLLYIPGYMPENSRDVQELTKQLKQSSGIMACKLEPCVPTNDDIQKQLQDAGWKKTTGVQYGHTVRLDLSQDKDQLWAGMKKRGRQEVNYARKHGVVIEESPATTEDFEIMYNLLKDTSRRKSFGIREKQGVMNFWNAFKTSGRLKLFFAKYDDKIIAGGIIITDGSDIAWYKDAGSLPEYAKMFGPRLLLWEVALGLQKEGFTMFDLGGIPAPNHYEQSDMKGIYIFKTAYTREITAMMPAYELPIRTLAHPAWKLLEPHALKANRFASRMQGKIRGR